MAELEKKGANIVFLDVDGVLNTATTVAGLEPSLIDNMAEFLKDNDDLLVVFSSTWRYGESYLRVIEELAERGVHTSRFISSTPDLSGVGVGLYPPSASHENRTHEILVWLFSNTVHQCTEFPFDSNKMESGQVVPARYTLEEKVLVANWIAVDDLLLSQRSCYAQICEMASHQVITKVATGFDEEARRRAQEIIDDPAFDYTLWADGVFLPCVNPDCLHKDDNSPTGVTKQEKEKCQVQ